MIPKLTSFSLLIHMNDLVLQIPAQGNVLVQLGSQLQKAAGLPQDHKASAALMPLLEVPVRASSEVTDLVTLGSSALSLQRDGTLLIHDLSGSYAETFRQQLPADHGARWLGLCPVRGREMLLVGSVHHGSELAVWRRSTQFFSFTAAVHGIPLACFAISAFPFGTQ
eukprot:s1754_g9.t1